MKETIEGLKTSLEFAEKKIDCLKGEMAKSTQAVDDNTEGIDSLDAELDTCKRQENMKIFNVQEELEEDTEKLVRNMSITKIPAKDVDSIRFERIHRIPTKPTSKRSQVRLRPIIAPAGFWPKPEEAL